MLIKFKNECGSVANIRHIHFCTLFKHLTSLLLNCRLKIKKKSIITINPGSGLELINNKYNKKCMYYFFLIVIGMVCTAQFVYQVLYSIL